MLLLCLPVYGAEPIDGFRELKFGMTPQEVHALTNCSTSRECIYELSQKNRYVHLTYEPDATTQEAESTEHLRLTKITIDMGQHTDEWYHQLQMILRNSYRLTHDFTDETMNAFLANQLETLQAGYENGQVLLTIVRRQFGNLTLKIVYQNMTRAAKFVEEKTIPLSAIR
jgi:hypothetical protein